MRDLAEMAQRYACDIKRPADNAREAVQWTYLAYLGAIKEAKRCGHVDRPHFHFPRHFYIARDMHEGVLDESGAQELIDQLVQKLWIRPLSCGRPIMTRCSVAIPTG